MKPPGPPRGPCWTENPGVRGTLINGRGDMFSRSKLGIVLAAFLLPGSLSAQAGEDALASSLDSILGLTVNAAARHDQASREAPASVTIMTSEDILRFGYQTVGEVLGGLPGFYNTYDRNYLYAGVRGFSRPGEYNNRVLLLVDGNPFNEPFWGYGAVGTDLALPLEVVDRIEIIRGPGSALYGNNAMLAVVNLITKKGRDLPGFRTIGRLGSLGEVQGSVSLGKEFVGGSDLVLVGYGFRSEGEAIRFREFAEDEEDGVVRGMDWDRALGFRGVLRITDFYISVLGSYRKKAIPTAPWGTLFDVLSFSSDRRLAVEGVLERSLAPGRTLALRGFVNRFEENGSYPYDPEGVGEWRERSRSQWAGLEVRHTWDISGGHRLILAGEARRIWEASYSALDNSGLLNRIDQPFNIVSGLVQDEFHLGQRLLFTGGLRVDKVGGRDVELSPRFALVAQPTGRLTVKLLYGSAFRAPNRYELFYVDEGRHGPSTALESERLETLEVVVEQRIGGPLVGTLSLYQTELEGFIDLDYDEVRKETFFTNLQGARALGTEVGLLARHRSGSSARLTYGYVLAEDLEYDMDLSNSPKHLARAALSGPALRGVRPALEVRYDGARWTVYETRTDSFLLTNLIFSLAEGSGGFTGGLAIKNLLDEKYQLPGGWEHLQEGIPQRGRTFHLWFGLGF